MKRNNTFKWFIVALVTAWAIYSIYPPQGRPLLEQFQSAAVNRDTNFTAIVERAKSFDKDRPGKDYANLFEATGTNDLTKYFPNYATAADTDKNRATLNRLQKEAAGKIKLGLDLQGGTSFLVGVDTTKVSTNNPSGDTDNKAILSQAIEVLRRRVDRFGVAEPILQPVGENRILIQMPGLSETDIESVRNTIQKAAFLEFRLVHPQSDELIENGIGAPGYEKLYEKRKLKDGTIAQVPMLVKKGAEKGLTGKFVQHAYVTRDPMSNQPQIIMRFDAQGTDLFADITRANTGRRLGIVLDNTLASAPNINEPILGGSAQISGSYDVQEAFELANVLENPLQAPVQIEEQRGVGPSLGADSIRNGVRSALIGTIAVAAFMLVYYTLAGVVANVALLLNIIVLLAVLCSVGTTLTLPGIAGIVLTIGMAVDANVLIFERMREEQEAGKSLRGSIAAGYDKAFGTIFDSNLTTLIASVILIYMGTGPVKGFGVTLTIGVAVSMFTALIVTRLIFDFMLERNMIKSLKMFHFVRGTKIDFIKWAKPAFAVSWLLILIGLGYAAHRGKEMMGIDFAGGDGLTLTYEKRVEEQKLREVLEKAVGEVSIGYQTGGLNAGTTLQVTTPVKKGAEALTLLQTTFPDAKFKLSASDSVGASVGAEILRSALLAALLAMFGILVYVAMRYEFSFAIAAVVAIIHDILMTLGWFALTGREFSAPIVAAVLTIIGFSINDTIVIFDRIREDLKLGVRGSFSEVINKALNQTLSRTIITSGTVFLATMALYLFGGSVINDFAFTFLVGIITGTYSSIYIASALALWLNKGQRPQMSASQVPMDNSVTARV